MNNTSVRMNNTHVLVMNNTSVLMDKKKYS